MKFKNDPRVSAVERGEKDGNEGSRRDVPLDSKSETGTFSAVAHARAHRRTGLSAGAPLITKPLRLCVPNHSGRPLTPHSGWFCPHQSWTSVRCSLWPYQVRLCRSSSLPESFCPPTAPPSRILASSISAHIAILPLQTFRVCTALEFASISTFCASIERGVLVCLQP